MPIETRAAPMQAWIVLPGHRDARADIEVREYPFWTRLVRTLGLGAAWSVVTVSTFVITIFDPFLSSIPLTVGLFTVWRSWKGRFRVNRFAGDCPRCGTAMRLKPGSHISVPHPLVCYACHHEPELLF